MIISFTSPTFIPSSILLSLATSLLSHVCEGLITGGRFETGFGGWVQGCFCGLVMHGVVVGQVYGLGGKCMGK